MAAFRYYLSFFIVSAFLVLTPALGYVLFSLPVLHGMPLLALALTFLPLTLLYLVSNGNFVLAKLLNCVGLRAQAVQFYLNQIRIEKLRCHPDELRIDYTAQELADLFLELGEVDHAVNLTWSICDWKESNSRKRDPDHTQMTFSFARKLIANGHHTGAQSFMQRLVERRKKIFGDRHPAVGEAYLHLGNCYTTCDADLARAAYEEALPCFYPSLIECKQAGDIYFSRGKLKSEIVYLRVTALSNLASLAYSLGDLSTSSSFLEKCKSELQSNQASTLLLSNCRDIVLAQQAQILIDQGQSDKMYAVYDAFKRPAPASSRVGIALERSKRNAYLLSDQWTLHWIWCARSPFFMFLEPFGGYWTTWMSNVAVIAAHRD